MKISKISVLKIDMIMESWNINFPSLVTAVNCIFQPRIAAVPDGEWYCPLCVQRACRKVLCLLCAKWNRPNSQPLEPIIVCSKCYNGYHASCFDRSPTLSDPKQWTCPGCLNVSFDLSEFFEII